MRSLENCPQLKKILQDEKGCKYFPEKPSKKVMMKSLSHTYMTITIYFHYNKKKIKVYSENSVRK